MCQAMREAREEMPEALRPRGVKPRITNRRVRFPQAPKAPLFSLPPCTAHSLFSGKTEKREWGVHPQTVSKDNSLGSPQPPTFMLTQKISGIAGGATPSRAKK